ncbi:MAG: ABC transporter ATP-binding protein [Oscillospiraceae bacterium]|nr:ABC transporter ATP-binding protein [Oscillospiraceae bacterium]
MRTIFHYMKSHRPAIALVIVIKLIAALAELTIPYILEHMIDRVVPRGAFAPVLLWGFAMAAVALLARQCNVFSNSTSVTIARNCTEKMRQDLFFRTVYLSGSQIDTLGLPSLISRMTSDSYNIQNFIANIQTIGIRAPIMLLGGITITMVMEPVLASILCVMTPILIVVVVYVSWRGVPLYERVQQKLDGIVRIMRENITGIRVVKALSKEQFEKRRFREANDSMTISDLTAGFVMAIPGPFVTLCLNIGLVLVVVIGAHRVNAGASEPGVILAFLTYFHMILQSVMTLNRVFMQTPRHLPPPSVSWRYWKPKRINQSSR